MSETKPETTYEGPLTVVMVPKEYAEQVAEYIATLAEDAAEVSGYTFSRAVAGGGVSRGGLGAVQGTNCYVTGDPSTSTDYHCKDGSNMV